MEEHITLDAPEQPVGTVRYAGFWIRVAAAIIDGLILAVPITILFSLAFIPLIFANSPESSPFAFFISYFAACIVTILLSWLYFAVRESSARQGTFGKSAVGIKVTDLNGERISFARATGRYFSKALSSILYIGYIMVGFDECKQGLHDKIAGTLVVFK